MRGEVVNMDRFRAPDASDEIARCQSCGERFHYTQMDEYGHCQECSKDQGNNNEDEDEDNDMTEKEMRELDACIAEHVMGRRCDCTNGIKKKFGQKEYAAIRATNDIWIKNWPDQEPDLPCDHAPHYTTDPAAAMQVLEKCIESCGIELLWNRQDGYALYKVGTGTRMATADTLPLAICLFARKLYETKT